MATALSNAVEANGAARAHAKRAYAASCALVLIVYAVATLFTNAHFMADTADYVDGVLRHTEFWEFGHLFWRPLGWALFQVFEPLTRSVAGPDPTVNATLIFVAVNWVAGLLSVFLLHAFLLQVTKRERVALVAAIAFIFSHGFLNFAQTGSSYIPGLALLLLGLHLMAKSAEDAEDEARFSTRAVLAGLAFAGAVCMWFLHVWVVPAALLLPPLLSGFDRRRLWLTLQAASAFALALVIVYGAVLAHLGIYNIAELRAWIASSSHSISTSGVSRVVFGLPRSLINMGNDGMLFKRFLLGDPFNGVSAVDLFRLSLWKMALFYLFIAAVLLNLLRSRRGSRVAALLALGSAPLILFAIFFDGGAVERYLPLYPLIFLSLSCSVCGDRSLPSLKLVAFAFIIAASITNCLAMLKPALDRQQEAVAARIDQLLPLKQGSLLVTINQQDELVNFQRSFPFNPINSQADFHVYSIVALNTAQVERWREQFAAQALAAWERGGDVWITERVRSERPRSEWNWVEGDDRRVGWSDLSAFFSQLKMDASTGEDEFARLLPSTENERLFIRLARKD